MKLVSAVVHLRAPAVPLEPCAVEALLWPRTAVVIPWPMARQRNEAYRGGLHSGPLFSTVLASAVRRTLGVYRPAPPAVAPAGPVLGFPEPPGGRGARAGSDFRPRFDTTAGACPLRTTPLALHRMSTYSTQDRFHIHAAVMGDLWVLPSPKIGCGRGFRPARAPPTGRVSCPAARPRRGPFTFKDEGG